MRLWSLAREALRVLLCGLCVCHLGAENAVSPSQDQPVAVPDPYGLGERLAIIAYLKDHHVSTRDGEGIEELRSQYRETAHEPIVISDGSTEQDYLAAEDRDRLRRLREGLITAYHIDVPVNSSEQMLLDLKHREEAKKLEALSKEIEKEQNRSGKNQGFTGDVKSNIEHLKRSVVLVCNVLEGRCGSGFFISDSGLLLTNFHVAGSRGSRVVVLWDQDEKIPSEGFTVVESLTNEGGGPQDLALLKPIDPHAHHGRYENLELDRTHALGDSLLCAGFPIPDVAQVLRTNLLDITITKGSITALRKRGDEVLWLQHDCATVQGSSGGPIIDTSSGKVVGIVTMGIDPNLLGAMGSNLYFAIPAATALNGFQSFLHSSR